MVLACIISGLLGCVPVRSCFNKASLDEKIVEEHSKVVFDALTNGQLIQLADHYRTEVPSVRLKGDVKNTMKSFPCNQKNGRETVAKTLLPFLCNSEPVTV